MVSLLMTCARTSAQIIGNDTVFECHEDSILIEAQPNFDAYLWNTGETTRSIFAKRSGWFKLQATEGNNTSLDSVCVKLGRPEIPFDDTVTCYEEALTIPVEKIEPQCLVMNVDFEKLTNSDYFDDNSGYDNRVYLLGGTVNQTDGRTENAKASHLENAVLYIDGNDTIFFDRSFTIHCWLAPDSAYGTKAGTDSLFMIFNHWNVQPNHENEKSFALAVNSHGQIVFMTYDGTAQDMFVAATDDSIPVNQWSMVDVVCSMNKIHIYVNGEEVLEGHITAFPQRLDYTTNRYYIGCSPADAYNHNYKGAIADFRLYTCDLSDTEIRNLLNNNTTYNHEYSWRNQHDGIMNSFNPYLEVNSTDTAGRWYYVDVSDEEGQWTYQCTDSVFVKSHAPIVIDMEQVAIGCPDTNAGMFIVDVAGGVPFGDTANVSTSYKITWPRGYPHVDSMGLVMRLRKGTYTVTVEDSVGCTESAEIEIETYPEINDSIKTNPEGVLYRQKPIISFSSEYNPDCYIESYFWDFGDGNTSTEPEAVHNYGEIPEDVTSFVVRNVLTDDNGCVDSTSITLEVKEAKLKIPNAFTPNGDGVNDAFEIRIQDDENRKLGEVFASNTFTVYNRQGKIVYQKENYESGEFDGNNLSDGVYFYILICRGQLKDDIYKGYIHIITRADF